MLDFVVISPETVEKLLDEIEKNKDSGFRFGAGFTDLLTEFRKQSGPPATVINLSYIASPVFCSIEKKEDFIRIGALSTASEIANNSFIKELFPVLHQAADTLASRQIRNVATIGGNICTASPAGDMSTALTAIDSICEILSSKNELREMPVRDFFTGVRKTDLKNNEILRSIKIPLKETNHKPISNYIKVGIRKSMECSVVSLAYHFYINEFGEITEAGVAFGSCAPKIMFAESACNFLRGKVISELNDENIEEFSKKVLEYASPISDIRGSEWYRKQVLFNISRSIFENN